MLLEAHPTILKVTLGSLYYSGWLFKTVSAYGLSSGLGLGVHKYEGPSLHCQ